MNASAIEKKQFADTMMIVCPVCESDVAGTLGVAGRTDGSLEATVILDCGRCDTVYLSPVPDAGDDNSAADHVMRDVFERQVIRLKKEIGNGLSCLIADANEKSVMAMDPGNGRFDYILLPMALESSGDPQQFLRHVSSLLNDGGLAAFVVGNTRSYCFANFSGRHWFGYRYPSARQFFNQSGVERLAERAGMRVSSCRQWFSSSAWRVSAANWMKDWGASKTSVSFVTGRWPLPWLWAAIAEGVATLFGKSAILVVTLEKE